MSYIFSNTNLEGLCKKAGFYVGKSLFIDKEIYRFCSYNKRKDFNDVFYTAISFSNESVFIELDEILFESPFVYSYKEFFIICDDLNLLIDFVQANNFYLSLSEQGFFESLCFGSNVSNNTLFKEIVRVDSFVKLPGVSISQRRKGDKRLNVRLEDESDWVYNNISDYYKGLPKSNKYFIGLSGGLDSRVGAFFASMYNLDLSPYFIGKEKNSIGLNTYDAKISKELAYKLNLETPVFLDPCSISWDEKIKNDTLNAAEMISNAHINCGYDVFSDTSFSIINGSMGGELFGSCLLGDEASLDDNMLVNRLVSFINIMPKIKRERNKIVKYLVKAGLFNRFKYPANLAKNHLIPTEVYDKTIEYLENWVLNKKSQGFENHQIVQLFLYEKLGRNHRKGYFFGFNGRYDVIPVFLRPSMFNRMMDWPACFFEHRKLQKELLSKLPIISTVKSQNVNDSKLKNNYVELGFVLAVFERLIRGGGMDYHTWVKSIYLDSELVVEVKNKKIFMEVLLDSPIMKLTYIKNSELIKRYIK